MHHTDLIRLVCPKQRRVCRHLYQEGSQIDRFHARCATANAWPPRHLDNTEPDSLPDTLSSSFFRWNLRLDAVLLLKGESYTFFPDARVFSEQLADLPTSLSFQTALDLHQLGRDLQQVREVR